MMFYTFDLFWIMPSKLADQFSGLYKESKHHPSFKKIPKRKLTKF